MKLRAPSPALVIAFIALVVALSATAYAATRVTSTGQIKNGIITSGDVKNKTLKTSDLAKSTLRRIDGGGGSASAAAATEGIRREGPLSQPANQIIKVAALTIPAGAYVITAKTTLAGSITPPNLFDPGAVVATAACKLDAGGDEDQADTTIVGSGRQTPGTMYMQTLRTLKASAAITIRCSSAVPWSAVNTSIIAQRVGSAAKKGTE